MIGIENWKNLFLRPLPGEDAHVEMAPMTRMRSSEALKNAFDYKKSAVAIHLFEAKQNIGILLTERSQYDGVHSGQISFPGGKMEPTDMDSIQTARRESFEETGISEDQGEHLGALTNVFIPVSNFLVYPHVFYHENADRQFQPNEREVAEIFHLPVEDLLNDHNVGRTEIRMKNGLNLKDIPCFTYQNKIIWGATAIILNELKVMVKEM